MHVNESTKRDARRVLVTGSSRGIGRAVARELARRGFAVTVHGRSASSPLDDARREIESETGAVLRSLAFDVADRAGAEREIARSVEADGPFYGVVCSSGIVADAPFPAMTGEQWDRVLATNLDGFFNVVRPLVMPMIQRRDGGRIVALSSLAGITGNRGQVNYSASKAALIGATKALARELAKRRISVNCVAPGPVETGMVPEELRAELLKTIPMQRFARPEEVAAAVAFLFEETSEYMTGQTLVLCGGMA